MLHSSKKGEAHSKFFTCLFGPKMPKRRVRDIQEDNNHLRIRSIRACGECRRRKRKCDGNTPCSSCEGYGYSCSYEPASTSHNAANVTEQKHYLDRSLHEGDMAPAKNNAAKDPGSELLPTHRPLVGSQNDRALNTCSAFALPRILGSELNDPTPPRLHSFGYHLGLRSERRSKYASNITSFLSEKECHGLVSVFFADVHPIFAFLQEDTFFSQAQSLWRDSTENPGLEALTCAVCVLGSFFSNPPHQHEEGLFSHCLSILDMANAEPVARPDEEFLEAWILRIVYLRLTTRPRIACMASHTAMQIAEVLGLHRSQEPKAVDKSSNNPHLDTTPGDRRQRLFWLTWALNHLLCTEYGLTPVALSSVTCGFFNDGSGTHSARFVSLIHILKDGFQGPINAVSPGEVERHFCRIQDLGTGPAIFTLFQAEVCLSLMRRILSVTRVISSSCQRIAISIIKGALSEIPEILSKHHPWWNVLSVPFQTVCVCLAVDSILILPLLPDAMELLQSIALAYDSKLAKEASSTAHHLIIASRQYEESKAKFKDMAIASTDLNFAQSGIDFELLCQNPALESLEEWFQFAT